MKIKNLKVNKSLPDQNMKLRHEINVCRIKLITTGAICVTGSGLISAVSNTNNDILLFSFVALTCYSAYLFGDSVREYHEIKDKQMKLTK